MVQAWQGQVHIRALFIFVKGDAFILGLIRIRIAYT